jgi:D-alanyl-D-alanine dipeptidase
MIKSLNKSFIFAFFLVIFACFEKPPLTNRGRTDLVEIAQLDSTIVIDIRYATENNFMGEKLYPVAKCLLRRETAQRLLRVQTALRQQGVGLKIWDGYRPLSVQWKMWKKVPKPGYVADPRKGSKHNRGGAVDLTLVDAQGNELKMPTGYDDFSERAHRDFMNLPADAIRNREILEQAMTKEGFIPLPTEWWHFDDPEWEKFELLDVPLEKFN